MLIDSGQLIERFNIQETKFVRNHETGVAHKKLGGKHRGRVFLQLIPLARQTTLSGLEFCQTEIFAVQGLTLHPATLKA